MPVAAVKDSYAAGVTDEFVEPVVCDRDGTISSMFSGGRWLRKGVKFRDE